MLVSVCMRTRQVYRFKNDLVKNKRTKCKKKDYGETISWLKFMVRNNPHILIADWWICSIVNRFFSSSLGSLALVAIYLVVRVIYYQLNWYQQKSTATQILFQHFYFVCCPLSPNYLPSKWICVLMTLSRLENLKMDFISHSIHCASCTHGRHIARFAQRPYQIDKSNFMVSLWIYSFKWFPAWYMTIIVADDYFTFAVWLRLARISANLISKKWQTHFNHWKKINSYFLVR